MLTMTMAVPDGVNTRKMHGKHPLGGPSELQTAWQMLAGGATSAAAALLDVVENSPVPGARVRAAQLVLEMTGFRSADTVPVLPAEFDEAKVQVAGDSPAERIRRRMDALAAAAPAPAVVPTLDDLQASAVVDAEIVED